MSQAVQEQEPQLLWKHFADLNAVPRPSKKEEQVRQFIIEFAKLHNLLFLEDAIGNVVIKKHATNGMEDRKPIIMQSHLDMVHQKNNDTDFNFLTQGIEMYVEDGNVKARGTTLGADNGIGVAAIMAVLSSSDIAHPAIEALFTIDEETGMTGAKQLDQNILTSKILLNLDTEEDDEIDIGCAGGVDITASKQYFTHEIEENDFHCKKITIKGLKGGHSGMDIIKGLGNANKLINRLIDAMQKKGDVHLNHFDGGSLRNAIPREATVTVCFRTSALNDIWSAYQKCRDSILDEYKHLEPGMIISIDDAEIDHVLSASDSRDLVFAILGIYNGVYRMSPEIDGLVETSNNLARIKLEKGALEIACLTRSSVESSKEDLASSIVGVMRLADLETKLSGEYPGWQPNRDSAILKIVEQSYEDLFNHKPRVVACHAGLECGLLGERYPELDMVSFGPNIRGAHSPDERVEIESVQKFWKWLLDVLKNIPKN
ncbi:MAG: aminoacyl-histidine dipeptidase [Nonlabens sp.]